MADKYKRIVRRMVDNIIGRNDVVIDVEIAKFCCPGENYLSDIFKLIVRYSDREGVERDMYLIAKCSINDRGLKMAYTTGRLMENEIICYETLISTLREFRIKYKFPDFEFIPRVISSHCNINEDLAVDSETVLILENLCNEGYTHLDRHIGYNLEQAKIILEKIAVFHSTGLALKQIDPELFEIKLRNTLLPIPPLPLDSSLPSAQLAILKKIVEPFEEFKDRSKFNRYVEKTEHELLTGEFFNPVSGDPFATLVHSDLWCNNIMHLIEDDKICATKIFDFQLARVGSPSWDLIFFLISSVEVDDLIANFDHLIEYYHTVLKHNLQEFKCYCEMFDYQHFLVEVKQYVHKTFVQCSHMLTNIILQPKGSRYDHTKAHVVNVAELHPIAKQKLCFLMKEAAKRDWF